MSGTVVRRGFDVAAQTQADDHLGRWPLAKEIYGIATTGPDEWSVRIGIYGEWGSGKTSVLNFVAELARTDKHVVVWFNPWQFRGRDELWRGFVVAVLKEIGTQLGAVRGARRAKAKEWGGKLTTAVGRIAGSAAGALSDRAGETVESGFGYLTGLLNFGEQDFKGMRATLDDRKIMVLVDDLDRTKPELVPEILFALKEILDVPGFSFICAFDPVVVGEVLGDYHSGFGDGLKFLEKIIDYPRWLPVPSSEGIRSLAHFEVSRYCDYVPLDAMDDVLQLLPQNPRVIRQFIRLLSLLKPQIERHLEGELRWSIILPSNVLKIIYPRLAQLLFGDGSIWTEIATVRMMGTIEKSGEDIVGKRLTGALDKACETVGIRLDSENHDRVLKILRRIAEPADFWQTDIDTISYQVHVAEAPRAITWKEYHEFLTAWKQRPDHNFASGWMSTHSSKIGRHVDEVYLGVLDATIRTREDLLSRAADVAIDSDMGPLLQQADSLLTLLEQLIFNLGGLDSDTKRFGETQINLAFSSLFRYAEWNGKKVYRALRKSEKDFLHRFVSEWTGDVTPLMNVLKPFSGILDDMVGKEAARIRKELRAAVVPRFAEQVLRGLCEQNYIERVARRDQGSYDIKCVLLNADGPLWKALEAEVKVLFAQACGDVNLQMNALELIHWFDYKMRREPQFAETKLVEELLRTPWACRLLWTAATAQPLNPRYVGQLREFTERVKELGVTLKLPNWWRLALKELGVEKKPAKVARTAPSS